MGEGIKRKGRSGRGGVRMGEGMEWRGRLENGSEAVHLVQYISKKGKQIQTTFNSILGKEIHFRSKLLFSLSLHLEVIARAH